MKKKFLIPLLLALLLLSACAAKAKGGISMDGAYTIEVTLSGGSGRASIESPAVLTVQDGNAAATVVWSSPFYEWMQVNGVQYEPVQTEGNATFVIPVTLDQDMSISAQTVAMSEPHVVDYTLHFDSTTVKPAE